MSRTGKEGLSEIRWLYSVQGIPESKPVKDTTGAVIECKARDRVEERLEVTLAGVAPASSGPHKTITTRAITPKGQSPNVPDGIVIGESKFSIGGKKLIKICGMYIKLYTGTVTNVL